MSRCIKHYDVKQLILSGCVPATREMVERAREGSHCFIAMLAALRFS